MSTSPQGKSLALAIKYRLLQRGGSLSAVARKLNYNRTTVSIAVNHPSVYPKVLELVKKEVGL